MNLNARAGERFTISHVFGNRGALAARKMHVHIYVYIRTYIHTRVLGIHPGAIPTSLPRLFSKTPPSLAKLISFPERKFGGARQRLR